MAKAVAMFGALDTKGEEYAFVKKLIAQQGFETLVVDFGVMGEPAIEPDILRQDIAAAGDGDLAYLCSGEHKDEAMRVMAQRLAVVARRLYDEGRLDSVIAMGGTGSTSVASTGMRTRRWGCPR